MRGDAGGAQRLAARQHEQGEEPEDPKHPAEEEAGSGISLSSIMAEGHQTDDERGHYGEKL